MLNQLSEMVENVLGLSPVLQEKIVMSLAILLGLWVLKLVILSVLLRRMEDLRTAYRWRKAFGYVFAAIAGIMVLRVWFEGIQSIATILGLFSAGVAIALQDPLVNLAGWAFILWRRPFEVGDRIQIGDHKGDVIDQRLFMFTLMELGNWVGADQSTGRVITVPNGKVFREMLANYSKGFQFIWNELPVLVTFESDWEKALGILEEIANRHSIHLSKKAEQNVRKASQKMMIFYDNLTPIVYTSVSDSGVLLTIRYLCNPRSRRGSAQAIWKDILKEFAQHDDIDFAYPTQRIYQNQREGKPGTRPEAAYRVDGAEGKTAGSTSTF